MPSLDFAEIKRISLVEVVSGRYKIPLRYRGDHAMAPCPLPTHKDGDKGRSFSINIPGNYWRCFSNSCVANNRDRRGGDVINFVALMENCREKDAAQKLADWYGVGSKALLSTTQSAIVNKPVNREKAASRMEKRHDTAPKSHTQTTNQNHGTSSGSVKGARYMEEIDAWYGLTFKRLPDEPDDAYRKRTVNAIKSKLVESYRNGKAAAS